MNTTTITTVNAPTATASNATINDFLSQLEAFEQDCITSFTPPSDDELTPPSPTATAAVITTTTTTSPTTAAATEKLTQTTTEPQMMSIALHSKGPRVVSLQTSLKCGPCRVPIMIKEPCQPEPTPPPYAGDEVLAQQQQFLFYETKLNQLQVQQDMVLSRLLSLEDMVGDMLKKVEKIENNTTPTTGENNDNTVKKEVGLLKQKLFTILTTLDEQQRTIQKTIDQIKIILVPQLNADPQQPQPPFVRPPIRCFPPGGRLPIGINPPVRAHPPMPQIPRDPRHRIEVPRDPRKDLRFATCDQKTMYIANNNVLLNNNDNKNDLPMMAPCVQPKQLNLALE